MSLIRRHVFRKGKAVYCYVLGPRCSSCCSVTNPEILRLMMMASLLCAGAHVAQTANALIANAVHIKWHMIRIFSWMMNACVCFLETRLCHMCHSLFLQTLQSYQSVCLYMYVFFHWVDVTWIQSLFIHTMVKYCALEHITGSVSWLTDWSVAYTHACAHMSCKLVGSSAVDEENTHRG